jgi:ABC-type Fe3+/spermidine/putrescine transport system ATPase subunit
MVISDRAAVLRNGRVEQIGPPHELFERPRTRFVAEFIGKTNLIDAVADGAGSVARGRLRLRVAADGLTPGMSAVVSIRPHLIALGPRAGAGTPPTGVNALAGTVLRASYLGDTVDYQVGLEESDVVLRVAGPTPARARAGDPVSITVPAESCVLLPADD